MHRMANQPPSLNQAKPSNKAPARIAAPGHAKMESDSATW